jgi:dihydropyrimidine dehydrogenase (NAD+) subunit PreA
MAVDLSVDFAGVKFVNPFVVAASPSSDRLELVGRSFEAGWAGSVLKTTSVEKEAVDLVFPIMAGVEVEEKRLGGLFNIDLISERHIDEIEKDIRILKKEFPDRVVIGSIMASSREDWVELVRRLEDAGADIIECSMSCPQGEGGSIPVADPVLTEKVTRWIKEAARRAPVCVKLTPNVTDIVAVARAAQAGGADALCAIDTVKALAGVDLETEEPLPSVGGKSTWGGLSGPAIKPIALGCVAELAQNVPLPIAGVGGITTWADAAEFILLGATTLQLCTAVMKYGFGIIEELCEGLAFYLERKGLSTVAQLRGRTLSRLVPHEELSRAYKAVSSIDHSMCQKDGLCVVACRDGAYGAITLGPDRLPLVDEEKCRGCGLCTAVCPVPGCIKLRPVAGGDGRKGRL